MQTELLRIEPNVYYTVEEAAEKLRVSPRTLLRLLRFGKIRGVKLDRQWRVLGAALLDLSVREEESEAVLLSDWLAASSRALREVWDNEGDAIYDRLSEG